MYDEIPRLVTQYTATARLADVLVVNHIAVESNFQKLFVHSMFILHDSCSQLSFHSVLKYHYVYATHEQNSSPVVIDNIVGIVFLYITPYLT